MNLLRFFLVCVIAFAQLFILYEYGLKDQSYVFAKYLAAFFFGMVIMEVVL